VTTSNLFDAKVLAKATKPSLVVIGPTVSAENAKSIQQAVGSTPIVTLASSFTNLEASQAAQQVLAAIQEKLPKN